MTDTVLTSEIRQKLLHVSTATLTTALFKRGFRNVFIGVGLINRDAPRMVGYAYTLRYIPAREDLDHLGVFADRTHPQRKAVEEIPPGAVMVIDSRNDARAASAGGILITRMMKRGAAGVVSDGGFRDTPDLEDLDFPVYCRNPSAPTNLIHHHAIDINLPIACGGVSVYPGDVIVGDREGVVVIPAHVAGEVADEAFEMTVYEDYVLDAVKEGNSIFGIYPPTDPKRKEEFESWRARNGR